MSVQRVLAMEGMEPSSSRFTTQLGRRQIHQHNYSTTSMGRAMGRLETLTKPIDREWTYSGGRELESMSFAMNYHRWILDIFRPFLGKRIVEVGAGSGSFSELILETRPESFDAIEPSAGMYPLLAERLRSIDTNRIAHTYQGTLSDNLESIRKKGAPDSIIYVNVLEHVEDDSCELAMMNSLLRPGGNILIFVPAMPWLMGSMDHQLGHFRRYTAGNLLEKCRNAGFTIRMCSYFDVMGIAPWWVKYCLLRSQTMEPAAVRFYDTYVVPLSRLLESAVPPPIGKSVILIAEKAEATAFTGSETNR
jgi:SAM-dependent methyltransferase